jgi:hypothetical protein
MKHVQIRLDDEVSEFLDTHFDHGFKQKFGEACFMALRHMVVTGKIATTAQVAAHTVQEVLNAGRQ